MAYNTDERFMRLPHPYRLLEPGSYHTEKIYRFKENKAPFLSRSERNTQSGNRIWTHAIYHADPHRKIPNCTSLSSKLPRFPYEALSKEDIEAILCKCGISNVCECPDEIEQGKEESCDAKTCKRLYKGPPPRAGNEGLSVPGRRDNGFELMPDGTHKRLLKPVNNLGPPFYDSEVIESTAFYRGCKWSKWRSTRTTKAHELRPGPADYSIEKTPTHDEICDEKIREQKRKHSKQLRYIEMIQQRDLREGRPGPATYSPKYSKDLDLKYFGPKAPRFHCTDELSPGPAAHTIKRDFDLPEPPLIPCLARLPEPSFFGVKAKRFKALTEEGPSPATYDQNNKICHTLNCSPPPFGSSAKRFKETLLESDENEQEEDIISTQEICPKPTWGFKSKTIRIKPLKKKYFEQSPADLPMQSISVKRPNELQYLSPFCSSEGRFQPWYNWISILGRLKTPGPGYYNLERYKCRPAVCQGPIFRAERFPTNNYQTPAPNEYKVGRGIETVLATYNERLKHNLENQHKFKWKTNYEPEKLSLLEQETMILEKAIASLDVNTDNEVQSNEVKETIESRESKVTVAPNDARKPKLLRCFLYNHSIKPSF